MIKFEKSAFTLSEILIALVILGIIAAVTIAVLSGNKNWPAYKSATIKALTTLDQANIQYRIKKGHIAKCGYWVKNPYGAAKCITYTKEGNCAKWGFASDGSALPSDYNGNFRDCKELYSMYSQILNVEKICKNNAFDQGCIPDYKGNDTVYQDKNPNKTSEEVNKATAGCTNFRKEALKKGAAMVLSDGMILIPYGNFWSGIMAIDVNGKRGPNKWGYDLRVFQPKMKTKTSDPKYFPGGCEVVEKGGLDTTTLLYKDISKY